MNDPRIVVAAFNGAWQGAVLCIAAYGLLRFFRRPNATTLFAAWGTLWVICVALPIANYVFAAKPYRIDVVQPLSPAAAVIPMNTSSKISSAHAGDMTRHFPAYFSAVAESSAATRAAELHSAALSERTLGALGRRAATAVRSVLAESALVLWVFALIAGVRIAILLRDLWGMLLARHRVTPIEPPATLRRFGRRPVAFASSDEFSSPCVLGFWPALIVIPEPILRGPHDQLHTILLHECEHARRWDDVQNIALRLIDALVFFCPGVLLAARQLTLYREQICDDAAVAGSGDAVSYAKTLAAIAAFVPASGTPVPGLIFERKDLLRRVQVLLDAAASHSLQLNRRFALGATAIFVLAATLVLRVQVPVIGDSPGEGAAPNGGAEAAQPSDVAVHLHDHDSDVSDGRTLASMPRTFAGRFSLSGCRTAGDVRLELSYHYSSPGHHDSDDVADCVPFTEFRGLTMADLVSAKEGHRTFAIVRDAGTMQAAGRVGNGAGAGTWTFVPSAALAANFEHSGIAAPDPRQQFELMLGDFRLGTLNALGRDGFAPPSVDELVRMPEVGVTQNFIDAALRLASQTKTVAQLIHAAEVGLTASDITQFERLGYRPTVDELIRLQEVGVTTNYVDELKKLGYHPLPDTLVRLKEVGVSTGDVARFGHLGYHPTPDELIRLQEVGVTPAWVRSHAYGHPSIDDLIQLKERGG